MKQFLILHYPGQEKPSMTPEIMEQWQSWWNSIQDKVIDNGNPLNSDGVEVSSTGVKTMTLEDWPATGYMKIAVETLEEAVKIAQSSPYTQAGSSGIMRVYECLPAKDM